MKLYRIYKDSKDIVICADTWDIDNKNLLTFYKDLSPVKKIVAVFNLNNIMGFGEL